MALVTTNFTIHGPSVLVNWPRPFTTWPDEHLSLAGVTYHDDAVTAVGNVVYMHGAGQVGFLSGPLIDHLTANGYRVTTVMSFGFDPSSKNAWRYNFGSNYAMENSARHHRLIPWAVASILKAAEGNTLPIVVVGQSMGAAGSLYAAAYDWMEVLGDDLRSPVPSLAPLGTRLCGFILNGVTAGGDELGSWIDADRTISSFSDALYRNKYRTILSYGDQDALASADFIKRMQLSIPVDSSTFLISAGAREHNWMNNDTAGADIVLNWVNQMRTGAAITTLTGGAAVAGPVVS